MSYFEIKDINKSFFKGHNKIEVFKDFCLKIENNEFLSIVGPSGSGKSTLLHIMGGLDKPDSGIVNFDGNNIYDEYFDIDGYRNSKVGFVFQFHYLLNDFSAIENTAMPSLIKGTDRDTALKNAETLLEKVGLKERITHYPSELSGGEQQRVAIARALMNNPKVILADEPTGNLDKANSIEVFNIFKKLNDEGVAVIMVTHDEKLSDLAGRVVKLEKH